MLILPGSTASELRALLREIDVSLDLARDRQRSARVAPSVSRWSVEGHLEHLAKADRRILDWLHRVAMGEEAPAAGRPTRIGYAVLLLGFIPRGKGKAPAWTQPESRDGGVIVDALGEALASARRLIGSVTELRSKGARMPHPILGSFSPYQWIRFAHVHHVHHRRIMTDILARASQ